MISAKIGHIQFNVATKNLPFYKELFTFLDWKTIYEEHEMLAVGDGVSISLWFLGNAKNVENNYDGPGMNHLALNVKSQGDVDQFAEYLQKKNIPCLFETPRHRPEFSRDEEHTYYQVMFETPDKILLEVLYEGVLVK